VCVRRFFEIILKIKNFLCGWTLFGKKISCW
jgi:hypothetical protein